MNSRTELSNFVEQNYNVVNKQVRDSGNIVLEVEEFKAVGIRKIVLSKAKVQGLCIDFGSSDEQAEFLSSELDINQGVNKNSAWVWQYPKSLDETSDLLKNILQLSNTHSEKQIEEFESGYKRAEIEASALDTMTYTEKAKYNGFWEVAKKLNAHLGSIFHVDHATSIKQGRKSAIVNSNLQILLKGINTSKNDSSWTRFTYEQQCEHILHCARIIPHADEELINLLVKQLELYWD